MMLWSMLLGLALLAGGQEQAAAKKELRRPADWVTRPDPGADAARTLYFVSMPPGWHITTGSGTILYDPAKTCSGRCRVEAEIYLFPGTSDGGYGLFVGGRHLDAESGPSYQALLLRRDGAMTMTSWIGGARTAAPWVPGFAGRVVVPGAREPVKNVIAVEVDGIEAKFFVNGHLVSHDTFHTPAPAPLPFDGIVGLRLDPDVNLHVTRLDVIDRP